MTILDFPTGGRAARPAWPRSAHPTTAVRRSSTAQDMGEPPTGRWLEAYEQLAACCAEVVATPPRVYDADWDELVDWIRDRLAALDALRTPGAS